MHALLLVALWSCTSELPPARSPDAGTLPEFQLSRSEPQSATLLSDPTMRSQARLSLADTNIPANVQAKRRIEVPVNKGAGRRGTRIPLPIRIDGEAQKTIATDLEVTVDGTPLRYRSLGSGPNSWHLKGDSEIVVQTAGQRIVVEYGGSERLQDRLVLSKSGLDPAEFVATSLTLANHTRQGLLLPTPSAMEWTLDIPEGASFEAFPALKPPSMNGTSDGLDVVLSITKDGAKTEIARTPVRESKFTTWRVDLTAHAGKGVMLSLETQAFGTSDWDYAFVGSPRIWSPPKSPVRRVLVIGLDTTRPDKFGWFGNPSRPTPELDAIANQSVVFTRAWTPAPRTRPSFRSATTGRYPLEAVGAENIGAVFQRHGFATAGIVANIHLQPRFDFDDGFDSWAFDGRAKADQQVDDALAYFRAHSDRDSYLFLHIMDPHLPYIPPTPFQNAFVKDPDPELPRGFNRTDVNRWRREGSLSEQRKNHIRALYDAELAFTSQQVGRLVAALDAMPGETLLVIHSDHGEELWEHDGFEHNHTVYDEVTKAVLWVRPPGGTVGGPVVSEQPATLADIAPTLYDFLDFKDLPPTDGTSLRAAMEGASPVPRDLGIAHIRYGHERWAVVHDNHKYIVATGTGKEELYALEAGPDESTNLATTADLAPFRQALVKAHPGLQAGPGWRIGLKLPPRSGPLVVSLPKPASATGVMDPESLMKSRSNLAWGEKPKRTASEVGEATLSEDRQTLTFTPGKRPNGTIWVRFEEPTAVDGSEVTLGGRSLPLTAAKGRHSHIGASGSRVDILPGFVLNPPPGESARMAALSGSQPESADTQETCRLCILGYNDGDECLECEGYNP